MKNKVVVIYYHEVVEDGMGFSYQKIDKTKFEKQMKYLHDEGYSSILFSELERPILDKTVIVSFDDGFKSVYQNAYPIMERYGIKGNIYLPTRYIGVDDKFMTWEMVQELHETDMFEFAGHTHNHVDIRTLSEENLMKEIEKSDSIIKDRLGYMPKAFCMPYGTYDNKSINLLNKMDVYQYILGSFYGMIQQDSLENKVLPRIGISNSDSDLIFKRKLEGKLNWKGYLQRIRLYLQTKAGKRVTQYEY